MPRQSKFEQLPTEEYLATKCELPKINAFECSDNDESSDNLEIVVAKQNTCEAELAKAAWVPLQRDGFISLDDSSDELRAGELFYEFLGKNFPFREDRDKFAGFMEEIYGEGACGDLGWLYEDLSNNSLPRPDIKVDAMEDKDMLGRCEGETIYVNQRLVLDAISDDPRDCFILFLAMLIEYGHFLNHVLHGKANKPIDNSKKVGRTFAFMFARHSEANLFNADFEFADFMAPDARGREQKFTLKISDLSRKQRKKILYKFGSAKIWEGEV